MTTEPKKTGRFGPGNPGKPKGATNKVTADLKAMIRAALDNAGGVDYLTERANDPRTMAAFLSLVGKVLPMTVAGDPDNPIKARVEVVFVEPPKR